MHQVFMGEQNQHNLIKLNNVTACNNSFLVFTLWDTLVLRLFCQSLSDVALNKQQMEAACPKKNKKSLQHSFFVCDLPSFLNSNQTSGWS